MHCESLLFSFQGQICCLMSLCPLSCWPQALKKELEKHMEHVLVLSYWGCIVSTASYPHLQLCWLFLCEHLYLDLCVVADWGSLSLLVLSEMSR